MSKTFLIMLRCASDDIPLLLLGDERDAREAASAITPAKAWAFVRASEWSSYSDPIAVVVLTFRDGVMVHEHTAIDCQAAGWRSFDESPDCSPDCDMPPGVKWLQQQGFSVQYMGDGSWTVRSGN
jgi:hypothetical protein